MTDFHIAGTIDEHGVGDLRPFTVADRAPRATAPVKASVPAPVVVAAVVCIATVAWIGSQVASRFADASSVAGATAAPAPAPGSDGVAETAATPTQDVSSTPAASAVVRSARSPAKPAVKAIHHPHDPSASASGSPPHGGSTEPAPASPGDVPSLDTLRDLNRSM